MYRLKPLKTLVRGLHKIAISRKTESFGTISLFFLQKHGSFALSVKIFKKIHLKMKSLQTLKSIKKRFQAYKIGDLPYKNMEVKMVLFYLLQRTISDEPHIM